VEVDESLQTVQV